MVDNSKWQEIAHEPYDQRHVRGDGALGNVLRRSDIPPMSKIPQKLSVGEETFAQQCQAYKITPDREVLFMPGRKWAFDFAWPDLKIAIEVEGGTSFGKSRHSRGAGFENDCKKYNAATRLGWKVLRYSTAMVQRGDAINEVLELL